MLFKKVSATLCLVLGVFSMYAQSATEGVKFNPPAEKDYWSVRWAPLSILELHTPSLRFSSEYIPFRFNHKWGFKLDLGYGIEELKKFGDTSGPKEFSMDYRAEAKFFPKAEFDKWNYYSAELFFIDHNSSVGINTFGLNAKVGKNYYFSSRDLVLDLYFGLGVRVIDVDRDTLEPSEPNYQKGFSLVPDPSDQVGMKILPNISLGVQFGFNL